MSRKVLDKILNSADRADQYKVANYLDKQIEYINKYCDAFIEDRCNYSNVILTLLTHSLSTNDPRFTKNIDEFITRYSDKEDTIYTLLHSSRCERCAPALFDFLNKIDINGDYNS